MSCRCLPDDYPLGMSSQTKSLHKVDEVFGTEVQGACFCLRCKSRASDKARIPFS